MRDRRMCTEARGQISFFKYITHTHTALTDSFGERMKSSRGLRCKNDSKNEMWIYKKREGSMRDNL